MSVQKKQEGYGKGKTLVIIIAVILAAVIAAAAVFLSDSLGVNTKGESKRVEIADGDGVSTIAQKLKDEGIIKYPFLFKLQAKLGGYDGGMQPGAATIEDGMSYSDILSLMVEPNRETTKIVIPEGFEIRQIADRLEEAGVVSRDEFYAALNPADYSYRFLENLPEREMKLEGYLFPATYEIPVGMSAHDIVDLMLAAFDAQFTQEFYDRAAFFGMTTDQVVTMASIVERETDSETERAKVAGVFYNRRNAGMKFQSCATVQYVLGEHKPVLSIADTQIDSPYNTYMYPDFPPGPICNPGLDCLKAAIYPEATDAYYFVLGANGEHIFSNTYEEHVAAMNSTDMNISVDSSALENQDGMRGGAPAADANAAPAQ